MRTRLVAPTLRALTACKRKVGRSRAHRDAAAQRERELAGGIDDALGGAIELPRRGGGEHVGEHVGGKKPSLLLEPHANPMGERHNNEHLVSDDSDDRERAPIGATAAARALLLEYRALVVFESEAKQEGCCKAKKKKKTTAKKQAETTAAHSLGFLRKGLVGSVFVIHPLVANTAFRAVHCIALDGEWIVASAPTMHCACDDSKPAATQCEHLPTYLLAWLTIAVSIVGFPLFTIAVLARDAGWCSSRGPPHAQRDAQHELNATEGNGAVDVDEGGGIDTVTDAAAERGATREGAEGRLAQPLAASDAGAADVVDLAMGGEMGVVSGGLCCRCARCVGCLQRSRVALDAAHDIKSRPGHHHSWAGFTRGDYKPEFFYVRLIFYCALSSLSSSILSSSAHLAPRHHPRFC